MLVCLIIRWGRYVENQVNLTGRAVDGRFLMGRFVFRARSLLCLHAPTPGGERHGWMRSTTAPLVSTYLLRRYASCVVGTNPAAVPGGAADENIK